MKKIITYSLTIGQMDCIPDDGDRQDIVAKVHWAYTGTDGTNSAGLGGTTDLTYDPESHDFTPYSELTKEQVIEWVLNAWTPEELARNQGIIEGQLATVSQSLPWKEESVSMVPTAEVPPAPTSVEEVPSQ